MMTKATVIVLLTCHAGLLLHSSAKNYVTVDEAGHVSAGISHWETATYSMYRVNPPFGRMIAVLPVLLHSPNTRGIQPDDTPGRRAEWSSGLRFYRDNPDHYFDYVCLARLAGVVWSLLGGLLIFLWARELYGAAAGCLGLALWCFGPNILAHAPLVTPDIPATVAGLAATYVFWRYLRYPSWRGTCLVGLLLGVAQLTKFTLLILYAIWPVLWLAYRLPHNHSATGGRHGLPTQVCQGLLMVMLSLLIINLGYEFRRSFRPLGQIPFISQLFTGVWLEGTDSGNRFQDSWVGSVLVPLPEDYLRGIDVQRNGFERSSETKRSYLAGEWRDRGWWYYYLYALVVKVPLGIWGLVLWGLILTLSGHPASIRWRDELTLWLPAVAVLTLVSSQTGFNRHLRYILPLFPFVLISTSKLAYFLQPGRWKAGVVVLGLLAWGVGSSVSVRPHYLSYFNELAGGPENGHDHLLSSNIDWGQDLLFLKKWLDEHPEARPLGLAYFNVLDARLVGIEYTLPPFGPTCSSLRDLTRSSELGPQPGYFAVSVEYVRGSNNLSPSNGRGAQVVLPPHAFEYFHKFKPIAKAGYSIFIYRITLEEANTVRIQYGLPPLPPVLR